MRIFLTLAGASLLLAGPALAATQIIDTTTTTVATPPATVLVQTSPAPVVVPPPPAQTTIILPPATNSGASGVGGNSAIGSAGQPRVIEIWREYYVGPDGQIRERVVTQPRAP